MVFSYDFDAVVVAIAFLLKCSMIMSGSESGRENEQEQERRKEIERDIQNILIVTIVKLADCHLYGRNLPK